MVKANLNAHILSRGPLKRDIPFSREVKQEQNTYGQIVRKNLKILKQVSYC